jgi:hypothetical protein
MVFRLLTAKPQYIKKAAHRSFFYKQVVLFLNFFPDQGAGPYYCSIAGF